MVQWLDLEKDKPSGSALLKSFTKLFIGDAPDVRGRSMTPNGRFWPLEIFDLSLLQSLSLGCMPDLPPTVIGLYHICLSIFPQSHQIVSYRDHI